METPARFAAENGKKAGSVAKLAGFVQEEEDKSNEGIKDTGCKGSS